MAMGQQPEPGEDPDRAAQVDEQMAQLLREHRARVYRLVRRKGFSDDDATEIVHISTVAVSQRLLEKGPVDGELAAYFTKVVKNRIAQRKRDEARDPVKLVGDDVLEAQSVDLVSQEEPAPARRAPEREAQLRAALAAVAELPPYLKEPFELEVYERLKPREIARRLSKKPGTIRVYLSLAEDLVEERTAELLRTREDEQEGNDDE